MGPSLQPPERMQVLLGPGQQSEARGISQVFCAWHQSAKTVESSAREGALMVAHGQLLG